MPVRSKWQSLPTEAINPATLGIDKLAAGDIVELMLGEDRKMLAAVQREHERIANQRRDFLYKLSHRLLTRYDHLAVEDLRIRNLVQNRYLSKSILDAGWGLFAAHLTSKAANAGREVVFVNPAYTSRTCHACGQIVLHLPLSQRVFRCACGYVADRDGNAARNILRLGQSLWGISSTMVGLPQEAAPL